MVELKKLYIIGMALLLTACSSGAASNEIKTITDNDTNVEIESVEPLEDSLLLDWGLDNMDRGKHDYETSANSRLVVDPIDNELKRGDVIYFKSPEFTIEDNPEFDMQESLA